MPKNTLLNSKQRWSCQFFKTTKNSMLFAPKTTESEKIQKWKQDFLQDALLAIPSHL